MIEIFHSMILANQYMFQTVYVSTSMTIYVILVETIVSFYKKLYKNHNQVNYMISNDSGIATENCNVLVQDLILYLYLHKEVILDKMIRKI